MSGFRQAPPDPEKAARDGVANYVPARKQVNTDHKCQGTATEDCNRTAVWELDADGVKRYACGLCRAEYAISATNYREKRIWMATQPTPTSENRIAKIRMDRMEIEHLLGLPAGFKIEQVYSTQDPAGFNVVVSGPTLDQQPYDVEAPFLRGVFTRRTVRHAGRVWSCWDWNPEVDD